MFLLNYYACAGYLMVLLFNLSLIAQALSPMQEEYETTKLFPKSNKKSQVKNYIDDFKGKQDLLIKSSFEKLI